MRLIWLDGPAIGMDEDLVIRLRKHFGSASPAFGCSPLNYLISSLVTGPCSGMLVTLLLDMPSLSRGTRNLYPVLPVCLSENRNWLSHSL